jgi:putative ATP-dependent endonuclease of the OLD family
MKIYSITIENFRGIRRAKLALPDHAVLIGDNNTGKSSVLEAIDLVLGPDRLSRRPPVDEHDFYQVSICRSPPRVRRKAQRPSTRPRSWLR